MHHASSYQLRLNFIIRNRHSNGRHLTQHAIDAYVLRRVDCKEAQEKIETHLSICAVCRGWLEMTNSLMETIREQRGSKVISLRRDRSERRLKSREHFPAVETSQIWLEL